MGKSIDTTYQKQEAAPTVRPIIFAQGLFIYYLFREFTSQFLRFSNSMEQTSVKGKHCSSTKLLLLAIRWDNYVKLCLTKITESLTGHTKKQLIYLQTYLNCLFSIIHKCFACQYMPQCPGKVEKKHIQVCSSSVCTITSQANLLIILNIKGILSCYLMCQISTKCNKKVSFIGGTKAFV